MSIHIIEPGLFLSVQDLGRVGFRKFGVSAAGPMDADLLILANALCSNIRDAATLEFASRGGKFRTDTPVSLAVTGGDCDLRVNGERQNAGETLSLNAGDILTIGVLRDATWGYLAVAGGFQTDLVMGARSTHLRFGIGGHEGRALVAGDSLPLSDQASESPLLRLPNDWIGRSAISNARPIRIMLGPQDDYFAPEIIDRLVTEEFVITPERDRMATVLGGACLPAKRGHDIVSDGTVPGSIQVPSTGRPIVLMAECQTTGGYPKIATVISADLARLAQMPIGRRFRFQIVDRETAEDAARDHYARLQELLTSIAPKEATKLSSEYLLSCDLVGGIAAPDEILGHVLEAEGSNEQ